VHFDFNYYFYVNVNASKTFRIKAIVYYIKDNNFDFVIINYSNTFKALVALYLKKSSIKLIMFLSC
jgi:hypothetical protein